MMAVHKENMMLDIQVERICRLALAVSFSLFSVFVLLLSDCLERCMRTRFMYRMYFTGMNRSFYGIRHGSALTRSEIA